MESKTRVEEKIDGEFLCEYLWMMILSLLPVKFVLRCRCVCKSWNDLIKTPLFISNHLTRFTIPSSSQKPLDLLLYHDNKFQSRDYYYPERSNVFRLFYDIKSQDPYLKMVYPYMSHIIVGCCNGLICLSTEHGYYITIWNPLIQKSITVPNKHFSLAYNWKCVYLGFYYDSLVNDYKVIRIVISEKERRINDLQARLTEIEIYSIKRRSWKILNSCFPSIKTKSKCYNPVLLHGSLHWLAYGHEEPQDMFIISFDVSTEEFGTIMLPERFREHDVSMHLFMGSISLVLNEKDVWVMKEYGVVDSWVKEFSVRDVEFVDEERLYSYGYGSDGLLGFLFNGDVLYRRATGKVIVIDHVNKEISYTDIDQRHLSYSRFNLSDHHFYVESLLLLDEPSQEAT